MENIIKKVDLEGYIENLKSYFSREKDIVLEGDYNLHYKFLKELLNTRFSEPDKVKDLKTTINHINKKGLLRLDDIFEIVKIVKYFIYFRGLELGERTRKWINDIVIPDEIYEIVSFFDEKGKIIPEKDERIVKFNSLIERERKNLRDRVYSITSSKGVAEYLVDRQVHLVNGEETVLVRGGFSSVLKGRVVSRSGSGFFYVLPDAAGSIKREIDSLQERLADVIYEYENSFSQTLFKFVPFIRFINKEFDRLDHYQARVNFAKTKDLDFCLAENSDKIILDGFIHPVLKDPVPFSVDFSKNILMITGVNAGGKTMLLKSILAASFMTKYLIPFKFNPKKTHIGRFRTIKGIIEDPQNSKNDISTFAGRMKEFGAVLKERSTLLGVDEIELGTDSDEAASLFEVLLEELIHKGSKVVITTHHKRLAAMMAGNEQVHLIAAMYDEKMQKPLYSFLDGSIGKSYAFETALRYGVPDFLVKKAKVVYGEDKEKLNDLIQRSSELELKQQKKLEELSSETEAVKKERAGVQDLKEGLQKELMEKRAKLEGSFHEAIQKAKEAVKLSDSKDIHRKLNEAHKSKKSLGKCQVKEELEFKERDSVKYLSSSCTVLKVRKEDLLLDVDGKKVYAPKLKVTHAPKVPKKIKPPKISVSKPKSIQIKLDLHGLRAEEALDKLDKFVSDALIVGYDELLIYHGVGSGVLSKVVKEYLKEHPHVKRIEDAHPSMGGSGATVAFL